ncbi:hypothetical protein LOTGIDRAFT_153392 [Lottia gigantea]|uniref:SCP domain-containing protein n=1 Tax=Lottia gigantea TaxID=225164 RepID=V4BXU7_LOTGI|nr:hypothetical protein LOTGIDRAFT_153392 [Lottia gigantea]ESO93919.1 hypothetical protein LOTGIDRAFT_153392 [Lottia gigantea]
MVWDDELAAASTTHARNCDYRYSSAHDYGENIAVQGSLRPLDVNTVGAQHIRHWVDYEKQFNDGTWSCCSERGYSCCEYAQVVSKSTTSVGCGYAQCGVMPNLLVLVCRYKPSGKIRGESPYV